MFLKINSLKNYKWYQVFNTILFIFGFILMNIATFILFFRQATSSSSGAWPSDFNAYLQEMMGINSSYILPYPILFVTARCIYNITNTPELAMVLAVVLFNALAVIITKIIINKITQTYFLSTIATFCLFFLSMIYSNLFTQFGIPHRYAGVESPNPWHNATYLAARPFMILAFYYGVLTLESYESDFKKKATFNKQQIVKYFFLSISLFLVTMTKPSYTLIHFGATGITAIIRFIKNKFSTLRQSLLLALFYVPTIIVLLIQYSIDFVGDTPQGEYGLGIELFRAWSIHTDNIPLAIILAAAFPIVYLLLNFEKIKTDFLYRFGWIFYLFSLFTAISFFEKGIRESHGNFMWGYSCGLFIVFLVSVIKLIQDTSNMIIHNETIFSLIKFVIEWAFLILHTVMGLYYFYLLTAYGISYR